ncbi:MAG: hypothetical protein H6741_18170 [Alphaproteobacteria bacterium]|nr:hypothetical protein [Alphaproteobacteria bacterium]
MAVTQSSSNSYIIVIDNDNLSTEDAFRLKYGSSGTEILSFSESGTLTVTGAFKAENAIMIEQRNTADIVWFDDSSGATVAYVDNDGRWVCNADRGLVLAVASSLPVDSPAPGTTRLVHDTSSGNDYYIAGYIGGVWRLIELPN